MKTYEMMKITNRYFGKVLNKSDIEYIFERKATPDFAASLRYFGWDVECVADLFNATPTVKYTAKEVRTRRELDKMYGDVGVEW